MYACWHERIFIFTHYAHAHECTHAHTYMYTHTLTHKGSMGELLDELQQMKDVLSHSEADICKTVVDMPLKSVIKYLEEIHTIDKEDRLPTLIPSTICLQHFVSLRLQLRRSAKS